MELTLTVADVDEAFATAIAAGARSVAEPHDPSWGRRVSAVADHNDVLVGLVPAMPS